MSTPCSTPRRPCSPPNRRLDAAAAAALAIGLGLASGARAQQIVFDPKNNVQAVVQSARLLQQLTNQATQLSNQARMLAGSPLQQAGQISGTVSAIQQVSQNVEGLASDVNGVEQQFGSLYSGAHSGQSVMQLVSSSEQRLSTALKTAQDVARVTAQVQSLGQSRSARVQASLTASQAAQGQTAAIQSTTQLLGVLAEELASLRTLLAAQSRLLAEATAREAADHDSAGQAHQRLWSRAAGTVSAPSFDPLSNALH